MLDSYKPGSSSQDELDLIKELHQSCERLKTSIFKLAAETPQNEDMLSKFTTYKTNRIVNFSSDEILQASDDLNHVFEKYKTVIVDGTPAQDKAADHSLLDLDGIDLQVNTDPSATVSETKEVDVLCDVFSSANIDTNSDFLLPLVASKPEVTVVFQAESKTEQQSGNKLKALEELDVLSEHLLKENLLAGKKLDQQFIK